MGYDLLFRDSPGHPRSQMRSDAVVQALSAIDVIGRLCSPRSAYSPPDDIDVDELSEMLEEDEDAAERLSRYCLARGIERAAVEAVPADAAAFLDHLQGPSLAAITMPGPEGEVRDIYGRCVSFAATNGLRLWDPQTGEDIDLGHAGQLPPMWK
jgi:hypothetical protein